MAASRLVGLGCLAAQFIFTTSFALTEDPDAGNQSAGQTEPSPGFWSQFRDPDDGMLDMSQWLVDNAYGFLPVPIIISEPAFDNGLGLAAAFFHDDGEDTAGDNGEFALPDLSAVAAAYTGNDSWFVGGGHFNTWKEDSRRYLGFAGFADINLEFFGLPELPPVPGTGIGFNARGFFTDHELLFRLGRSNWFLGGEWRYLTTEVTLDLGTGIPELDNLTSDDTVSGFGAIAHYEKLDSNFSPSRGLSAKFIYRVNREALGSDYGFEEFTWAVRQYFRLGERYTLAWRFDGANATGDVPFYLAPSIDLQGIPAMRYQGDVVGTAEIRGGYDLTPRWSLIAFAGAGKVSGGFNDLGSAPTRTAFGAGIRYLVAKAFGMKVGLDLAKGPEDTVVYIVTGNAW